MAHEPVWGPWAGVPKSKHSLCAVEGCEHRGGPQRCIYDGSRHHHGCIHYDCTAAQNTTHGLTFRDGWGWLCPSHYAVLVSAQKRHEQARRNPARALTADERDGGARFEVAQNHGIDY
jgi:hypothetical protein